MAVRVKYRTRDGKADYGFSFEQQSDGNWRAYITSQPGYNGRPSDAHTTHRITEGSGRKYICWTGPLRTLDQAKSVAAQWADATQTYRAPVADSRPVQFVAVASRPDGGRHRPFRLIPFSCRNSAHGNHRRSVGHRRHRRVVQPAFRVTQRVYDQIRWSIGRRPAENGGMLGGDRREGVVRHFHFDQTGSRSAVTYSPDHEMLSRLLVEDWNPRDIQLMGFVHSHPGRSARPSAGDEYYAARILDALPRLDQLLIPIVFSRPDTGRFELFPYAARRIVGGVRVDRLELLLIEE